MNYLIWDFDGTLAFRDGLWSGALLEVLDQEVSHHGVSREAIQPYLRSGFPWHTPELSHSHLSSPELWWESLNPIFFQAYCALGLSKTLAQQLTTRVRSQYYNLSRWNVYDDTYQALDQLTSYGWRHIILSNHGPELTTLIEHLNLHTRVMKVFNSANTGYEKPHPAAFQLVLDAVTTYEKLWMIGDNIIADIYGAAYKGIPGILVRKPHPDAVHFCETLLQIVACVEA